VRLPAHRLNRDSLIALVLATEAILILVAFVITLFFPLTIGQMLGGGGHWVVQAGVGLLAGGILFAAVTLMVWLFPALMDSAGGLLREVIHQARPRSRDCAVISMAAGVGEELLFRAVLVPVAGPFASSLLFAAAHSFNAETWAGRLLYVLATFVVGLFLAWLFVAHGLWAAMVCHAAYDFVALEALRRDVFDRRRRPPSRTPRDASP
jgi:membrane protease YdiL (CAAX protease family)